MEAQNGPAHAKAWIGEGLRGRMGVGWVSVKVAGAGLVRRRWNGRRGNTVFDIGLSAATEPTVPQS